MKPVIARASLGQRARQLAKRLSRKKLELEFKFHTSFYVSGQHPRDLERFARQAMTKALDRLGFDPVSQEQFRAKKAVERRMLNRIGLSFQSPKNMKHLKALERQLRAIDFEVADLITESMGEEKAKGFALLLKHFSKTKPVPKTEKNRKTGSFQAQ
ncbi:MAG: hypothetical protein JW744_03390 [Candidatus Diapherotrites archaeon]|uniref:Uncharacterized protein n=1 Tax=Candidatus Iainarchaeum sp. TaxID=3101447 RepID=A0A939C4R7_9ARCH|nr:hypothetical protein [Candidatus Diapherotrites archaeon]